VHIVAEQKPLVAASEISSPAVIEHQVTPEVRPAQSAVGGKRRWVEDLVWLLFAFAAVVTAVSHLFSAIGG
jgi:hypothetical protein